MFVCCNFGEAIDTLHVTSVLTVDDDHDIAPVSVHHLLGAQSAVFQSLQV